VQDYIKMMLQRNQLSMRRIRIIFTAQNLFNQD
jgi:hypothetical protein